MVCPTDQISPSKWKHSVKIHNNVAKISNWCLMSASNKQRERCRRIRIRREIGDPKGLIPASCGFGIHRFSCKWGGRVRQATSRHEKFLSSLLATNWIRQGLGVAAITVITSVANPAFSASHEAWISIFASQENDGSVAYGVGWDDQHLLLASSEALEGCENDGGNYCLQLNFGFAACTAVAKGRYSGIGTGFGLTEDIAKAYSIQSCLNMGNFDCRIDFAKCPK